MRSKISYAVAAILGGTSIGASAAEPASGTGEAGAGGIEEVVVTAQRRTENIQDVPISMQALTSQTLQQLNVSTFDDYVKFLPNVTSANNGPGQNEVFMRGLSAGSQASQGSGSTGVWPNVAIYLDNQSGQLPNRNLDIYAADLNRIEVLEGPQGTLFGAGAQAGVIRYITNEPKLDVVEGNFKAGYGVTAHGDPNSQLTGVLNLPLIAGTAAVRAVIYNDHRGGYIDNVPATFTRKNTDFGIHYAGYAASAGGTCPDGHPPGVGGFCVPPGSAAINNNNTVARAINPVTYKGIRVEGKYKFNDDWDLLITQSYQEMDSRGVFYQQPNASDGAPLQPLQATLFNSAYDKDKFENTAWTVNGKFGPLKAVYTGGYLVRNVDQIGDYTNYSRGLYGDYYQCYGPGTGVPASTCYSPSAIWHAVERNQHQQHEFRLSTPDDWRARGIAGVYWEDNKLFDQTAWMYKNIPPCTSNGPGGAPGSPVAGLPGNAGCLSNVGTFPNTTVQSPGVQGDNTSFYQDQVRDTKQTAFFASFDYDLIPKVLTVTAGTRHFRFENSMNGSVLSSFGCYQQGVPPGGCLGLVGSYSFNLDNPLSGGPLQDTESGWKSRANLTWHIVPDVMVYYTFSQGFRPGGFNQNGGSLKALDPAFPAPNTQAQLILPRSYHSDDLTNNEIGWKTEFLDHRLQWNGAIYRETWSNVQVAFFDTGVTGNIFFDTNGQDFLIKGIETSVVAHLLPGLMLQGAGSWNYSRFQTNSPVLIDNNPGTANFGKQITNACTPLFICAPVLNPYGAKGSPSANTPPLQFSLRARYDWKLGAGYAPFVQVGASHSAHSFTQAGANPTFAPGGAVTTSRGRFENPAYSTYDASFGVAKDNWIVTAYGENLSNSNASVFVSTDQFIVAETPLRPRVLGLAFDYRF